MVGAGAIGAYLGAALVRGGAQDVVLVARGPHLEALRRDGLRVLSARGDVEIAVQATDDVGAVAGADSVIVGVKAPALPTLLPEIAPLLARDACVLPAQNGVPWWFFQSFAGPLADATLESTDPGGRIASAIAPKRVVGCVPYPAVEIVRPGVIRHVEGTRFTIGEPDGARSARCAEIAAALSAGGLKCPVEERIRDQIWLKLVGNVAFNPVSALTGATLGELGGLPEMREVLRGVMEEVAAVGEALGIELPVSIDRRLEAGLAVGDHRTSTLQDLEAGKPLELDCLTGAVIEIAARVGVDVPHVRTIHACTRLVEQVRAHQRGGAG